MFYSCSSYSETSILLVDSNYTGPKPVQPISRLRIKYIFLKEQLSYSFLLDSHFAGALSSKNGGGWLHMATVLYKFNKSHKWPLFSRSRWNTTCGMSCCSFGCLIGKYCVLFHYRANPNFQVTFSLSLSLTLLHDVKKII